MEAIDPPISNKGEETIYEAWGKCLSVFVHLQLNINSHTLTDCPQVQAAFDYDAQQPDELSLERGDVVKVFRKMPDGKLQQS